VKISLSNSNLGQRVERSYGKKRNPQGSAPKGSKQKGPYTEVRCQGQINMARRQLGKKLAKPKSERCECGERKDNSQKVSVKPKRGDAGEKKSKGKTS